MREIIFVGNPNAGKSTLFNALAHAHARTGNWHGVTVGALSRTIHSAEGTFVYTDLPGIYSLGGYSMEETRTIDYLREHKTSIVVNVVDVRCLSRSLLLTESLLRKNVSLIVVLTMYRGFQKSGGRLNKEALSRRLGVPVLVSDAFSRRDMLQLNAVLQSSAREERAQGTEQSGETMEEKGDIGTLLSDIYTPQRRKESAAEKICYNRILCLPIFFLLTGFAFFLTFGRGMVGTVCKDWLETLFCEHLSVWIGTFLPTDAVRALVCDGFLRSAGGVLSFLPQIAILYTFLLFLEESGYMSALAFTADGVFRKFGLNGRAVFCILLGFGCTAQAILSTRGFERREMQRRTILALPYISCSAKLPVYLTLLSSFFARPFLAVAGLYALGVLISLGVFALLPKEKEGDFLLELPQMQLPNAIFFAKTLLFRLKQFIIKIVTVVTAFTLVVWFFSSFSFTLQYVESGEESMLSSICCGLKYIFYPIGVYDWQTAFALFSGLVAKENVAGLLTMFYPGGLPYSVHTSIALAAFILFCSPCVSAIAASAREIGWGASLFNALFQTVTAVFASYAVYYVLEMPVLFFGFPLSLFVIYLCKRFCFERIYRPPVGHVKKFHR